MATAFSACGSDTVTIAVAGLKGLLHPIRGSLVRRAPIAAFGILVALAASSTPSHGEPPPIFLGKWGSFGVGPGQFTGPRDVAVDRSGVVYVLDSERCRVQVFDSNGGYLREWSISGVGPCGSPFGITVSSSGDIFIADTNNHRILRYNASGGLVTLWGSSGSEPGQFVAPLRVAVDQLGFVYVSDQGNHRVQKFTATGVND
ncbi:MAG: hypothetical protein ACREOU_10705 [Candidatus Eiseniibacteriota bacterium]